MPHPQRTVTIEGNALVVVPDGEVCRQLYAQAPVRVVHLLKEVTMDSGPGLGEALQNTVRRDGTVKWRLWKVTARRSCALQNGLPEWGALHPREYGQALKASAVINLNDTIPPGVENRFTSNDEDVLKIARLRWAERKAKLTALDPSVVVCGGTYSLTRALLAEAHDEYEEKEGFLLWQGVPFLSARHPSFRGKKHAEEYEQFRQDCLRAREWIYRGS